MGTDLGHVLDDISQTIGGGRSGVLASSFDLVIWNGLEAGEIGTPTVILRYHQGIVKSFNPTLEGAFSYLYHELKMRFGEKWHKRHLAEVPVIFTRIMEELGSIGLALQDSIDKPRIGRYGIPRFRVSFRLFADRPTVGIMFFDDGSAPTGFASGGGDVQEALSLTAAKALRYLEIR